MSRAKLRAEMDSLNAEALADSMLLLEWRTDPEVLKAVYRRAMNRSRKKDNLIAYYQMLKAELQNEMDKRLNTLIEESGKL